VNRIIPTPNAAVASVAVAVFLFGGSSTGGYYAFDFCGTGGEINQLNYPGFGNGPYNLESPSVSNVDVRDLGYIKSALRISNSELARYLGVSRQTLHLWKSGAHIKSHNLSKLQSLRGVADVIGNSQISVSSLQFNRKLAGGLTVLEIIEKGGDGSAAARSLIAMLDREKQNRRVWNEKFADRPVIASSRIGMGMAALRESG